ncbi:unnamed protein product [Staurois parvus]|uniref:Uncharacterized protein n=1 Tax=Staurois parvus TaxID=386267 RepID=A0ABN9BE58_9NEOB|nr:unnamed protein product [Staurois parvus]
MSPSECNFTSCIPITSVCHFSSGIPITLPLYIRYSRQSAPYTQSTPFHHISPSECPFTSYSPSECPFPSHVPISLPLSIGCAHLCPLNKTGAHQSAPLT